MEENVLTGIIVDVSESMKSSIGDGVFEKGKEWTRSIFQAINNLIKHDSPSSHKMFCLGIGAKWEKDLPFDLISMLNLFPKMPDPQLSFVQTIENILQILENYGADAVRKWASPKIIRKVVSDDDATLILLKLQSDIEFVKYFIDVCLPKACKGFKPEAIRRKKEGREMLIEQVITETDELSSKTMSFENPIVYVCRFRCKHFVRNKMFNCACHTCTFNGIKCKWHKNIEFPSCVCDTRFKWKLHWVCNCNICQSKIINFRAEFSNQCSFDFVNGSTFYPCDEKHMCPIKHCHRCHTCVFYHPHLKECLTQEKKQRHPILEKGAAVIETTLSIFRPATEEDVKMVVEKAKSFIQKDFTDSPVIYSVQRASRIVNGAVEDSLTEERIKELIELVKPFIYGLTPMFNALEKATFLFSDVKYNDYKKLLFVLSDGMPTDKRQTRSLLIGVTVVSCYISKISNVKPRRLYSEPSDEWEEGARLLFDLSSHISTQLLPHTMFIKRGWQIDIKNNKTKLFLQVNHPDNVEDACNLARDVLFCQDSLADILMSVSLDIYINQNITGFCPPNQESGTCYANASAAVLHLSMKRIIGREGGYPDFKALRQKLIDEFGNKGANTLSVLKTVCPEYRLQCKEVDINGAMHAIAAKRPVVARFSLTESDWTAFSNFYDENKTGILTRDKINFFSDDSCPEISGHAVVLTSYNSECLKFMNSWGTDWGDMGFFRVKNANVLKMKFIDVFWTLKDLTKSERDYYTKNEAGVAAKLESDLTGIQQAKYKCPDCKEESYVTEFEGQLFKAKCPECEKEFSFDTFDNVLALAMYLTSLYK